VRIKSALFLDFDNIFSGLLDLDRDAAIALAESPEQLVDHLGVHGLRDGDNRDLLVRRAYLNPAGTVADAALGNERGRLWLNKFRPHLVRAGFEVIDCPALTTRHKNAGDIRIVIDVLTALGSSVHYDEIIIASSDADFTPLLLKLRAEDRRTTIITAGTIAPAYQAVADHYIDETQLIKLLTIPPKAVEGEVDLVANRLISPAADDGGTFSASDTAMTLEEAEAKARALLSELIATSVGPLHLAAVGGAIHQAIPGNIIRDSKWFGQMTFGEFVQQHDPALQVRAHLFWDPARHDEPPEALPQLAQGPAVPQFISELCSATDMPSLTAASWNAAFDALAEYASTHQFSLTEATAWTRDALAERGYEVGRRVLSFIIRGCLFVSVRLDSNPPPTATDLREAFLASIAERARSAGLDPTEDQLDLLEQWFAGNGDLTGCDLTSSISATSI
jgi:hypothetical protein